MTRPHLFITGTDTNVGKTIITGLLARTLAQKGINVITQKWVQSGGGALSDVDIHDTFFRPANSPAPALRCPYRFSQAVSPHLAAEMAQQPVNKQTLYDAFEKLAAIYQPVLVEGSGGLMVPLTRTTTFLELIKELGLPVLIIAANKLGAINHTLLSIHACQSHNIPIRGVIFNSSGSGTEEKILRDNPEIVKTLSGVPFVETLPFLPDPYKPAKKIQAIAKELFGI